MLVERNISRDFKNSGSCCDRLESRNASTHDKITMWSIWYVLGREVMGFRRLVWKSEIFYTLMVLYVKFKLVGVTVINIH